MLMTTVLIILLLLAVATVILLALRMRWLKSQQALLSQQQADMSQKHSESLEKHRALEQENSALKARLGSITDLDAETQRLQAEAVRLREGAKQFFQKVQAQRQRAEQELKEQKQRSEQELSELRRINETESHTLQVKIDQLGSELKALDEEANLQSFAFYQPHYDFASSATYQAKLEEIRNHQKKMIQDKTAAVCPIEWQVNGSAAEGRKQINQTLKLLLRAFNGECDAAIAKVRYNNVHVMEARISKAYAAINAMADVQQCRIAPEYLDLKMQELHLAHEYQEKVQAEKEEQRRIREQMREEEIAQRELERARQEAEKEELRYEEALRKARLEAERAVGEKQQRLLSDIEELQRRLAEAHANKERAIARAQMTRSGHVYIISNIGSFGENVFKIGMTRRLDPMDRVRELGDASVPFQFDVHAIIYSDDAPTLETALHRMLHNRRVNRVNERKEFFRATIQEIAEIVQQHQGQIEIIHDAEAKEFRETLAIAKETTSDGSKANAKVVDATVEKRFRALVED